MEATKKAYGTHFLLLSSHYAVQRHCSSTSAKASSSSHSQNQQKSEIRVCTNRSCRKQGSLESLQVFSGIAPPYVAVNSCGCLGRCGSGPNVVILPEGVFVSHCGTPTKIAKTMSIVCGFGDNGDAANRTLEALASEESYSIALDLEPSIRRSKSFKARIAKLQEKLEPTNSGLNWL